MPPPHPESLRGRRPDDNGGRAPNAGAALYCAGFDRCALAAVSAGFSSRAGPSQRAARRPWPAARRLVLGVTPRWPGPMLA